MSTPKPVATKVVPAPVAEKVVVQDPVTDAFSSFFGSKKTAPKEPEPEPVSVPTPAPVKKAEPFSFFGNVLPKGTLNIAATQPKKKPTPVPAPTPVAKKPEPFSFLPKGTLNIGSVQPKKKATPAPAPAPAPVAKKPEPFSFLPKGTLNIGSVQPKKKAAPAPAPAPAPVAKKPAPFSFFGSAKKPEPKPVPAPAPAPVAKKPAPFSFLGSAKKPAANQSTKAQVPKNLPRGTINLKKVQPKKTPAPAPKKNFFGGAVAKTPVPAPTPTPAAPASKTFAIFGGGAKKTPAAKTAVKKTSPLPRGTISLKKVGTPVKAAKITPKDNIPVLSSWKQNADGSITGNITNSKVFRVNQKITTSSVRRGAKAGSVVTTSSGSKYRLS